MIFKFPFPNFNLTTTICTFSNTKTPLALYVVFRNVRSEGKRIFFVDLSIQIVYLIQTKTKVLSGLLLEGDSGEEVALWRLTSLFRSSKWSSSRLIIMKSLPMSPSAYFLFIRHLWKCQYRARVYWNLSYPFSIFKMIFLESNPLRL